MGRKLRRVPLDFAWPRNATWSGFLNPHAEHQHPCSVCDGSGESAEAKHVKDQWYGYVPFKPEDNGSVPFTPESPPVRAFAERNVANAPEYYGIGELAIRREAQRLSTLFNGRLCHHLNQADVDALVAADRLWDLTHVFSPETRWTPKNPPYRPTAQEVNSWSIGGMSHDSMNQWAVAQARCAQLGVSDSCTECAGEGYIWDSPEHQAKAEAWEPTEPPVGEGYQMWETVSEGSPISPVFASAQALAHWLASNPWGAGTGTTAEQWLAFIQEDGDAPSLVVRNGEILTGVQASNSHSTDD